MDVLGIKERVEELLKIFPELRDSNHKLFTQILIEDCGGIEKVLEMSALDVIELFVSNKVTAFGSVARASRKLQELQPEIRGKNRSERLDHQESVKEQLSQF